MTSSGATQTGVEGGQTGGGGCASWRLPRSLSPAHTPAPWTRAPELPAHCPELHLGSRLLSQACVQRRGPSRGRSVLALPARGGRALPGGPLPCLHPACPTWAPRAVHPTSCLCALHPHPRCGAPVRPRSHFLVLRARTSRQGPRLPSNRHCPAQRAVPVLAGSDPRLRATEPSLSLGPPEVPEAPPLPAPPRPAPRTPPGERGWGCRVTRGRRLGSGRRDLRQCRAALSAGLGSQGHLPAGHSEEGSLCPGRVSLPASVSPSVPCGE